MAENKMATIAAIYGKELGEDVILFDTERDSYVKSRFLDSGLQIYDVPNEKWIDAPYALTHLLTGRLEIAAEKSKEKSTPLRVRTPARLNFSVEKMFGGRMNTRARNVLERNGFLDIKDIYDTPPAELMRLPKMGDSVMTCIITKLNICGYDYEGHWGITLKEMWKQMKIMRKGKKERDRGKI
jgi:hypothetical protein